MTYLNGAGILNDALSMVQDKSTTLRAKALTWLNIAAQELATVRPWLFLNTVASVTPVNNAIAKPGDYGSFNYLELPTLAVFDNRNRLTPGEAISADNSSAGYVTPVGFTEDATQIILHGASWLTNTNLGYLIEPPVITDSADATVWPSQCRSVLMRYVLDSYYEYDMDERKTTAVQLSMKELSELKKWDNNQKPKTQNSRHGYRRTR